MKTRIEVAKELLTKDFIKTNEDYKSFVSATLKTLESRQKSAKKKKENPAHKRIMADISKTFPSGKLFCIKDITSTFADVSQNRATAMMKKLVDAGYAERIVGKNKSISYEMKKPYTVAEKVVS